jgi:3-methyl-2-oxobutanoate hydroxymethyltransferase
MCRARDVGFGHVGALSGWQTAAQGGYKRLGKTAEDAIKVFRRKS